MNIDDTYAFQNTLSRIRQRYALHFLEPAGSKSGEERRIEVLLTAAALRRHSDADLRFRSIYYASGNGSAPVDGPVVSSTSTTEETPATRSSTAGSSRESAPPVMRRRPLSDGSNSGPRGPSPIVGVDAPKSTDTTSTTPAKTSDTPAEPGKGWRKLKPGETP
jgi:hypothetical protein